MRTRIVIALAGLGVVLVAALLWHLGGEVREHSSQRALRALLKGTPASADRPQ